MKVFGILQRRLKCATAQRKKRKANKKQRKPNTKNTTNADGVSEFGFGIKNALNFEGLKGWGCGEPLHLRCDPFGESLPRRRQNDSAQH